MKNIVEIQMQNENVISQVMSSGSCVQTDDREKLKNYY